MTLLIEATVNGIKHYISNESIALPNRFYDPYILKIGSSKISIPSKYGGYAKLTYSNFSLSPDMFNAYNDNWPPPIDIDIIAYYANSDGSNSKKLFETTAHRSAITRDSIDYRFYGKNYSEVLTSQSFSGTLLSIFETYTNSSHLNIDLNSQFARDPSPDVSYTASGELLDILSDIAAFYSHLFYIDGNTMYLIDMQQDNTSRETGEDEFLTGIKYRDNIPYRFFTSGNYSVTGSYPYGEILDISPTCHSTQSNIEDAISNIKTIIEKSTIEITFPLDSGYIVQLGSKISWIDESLKHNSDIYMNVRSITYNFDKDEFTCEGEGELILSL